MPGCGWGLQPGTPPCILSPAAHPVPPQFPSSRAALCWLGLSEAVSDIYHHREPSLLGGTRRRQAAPVHSSVLKLVLWVFTLSWTRKSGLQRQP